VKPDLRTKGRRKAPLRWRVEVPNGTGPDTEQTFSCLRDAFTYMAHALTHGRDTAAVCRLPEKPEFDTAMEEGCRFERAFGDRSDEGG
jgi:hypothetical protein